LKAALVAMQHEHKRQAQMTMRKLVRQELKQAHLLDEDDDEEEQGGQWHDKLTVEEQNRMLELGCILRALWEGSDVIPKYTMVYDNTPLKRWYYLYYNYP
jgi:hypothetical protein